MAGSTPRVRARIIRSQDGELHHEYIVDGVAYSSVDDLQAALGGR